MSEPFVGEIRVFPFNFAPRGWALCNGQLLPISQNTALFSLLGTFYGGDGRTTFALPNLQGTTAIGTGQGPGLSPVVIGESGGASTVTLLESQLPAHRHTHSGAGTTNRPAPGLLPADGSALTPAAFSPQPHENMPPYLVANYCIALQGIYPPRS